MRAPGFGTFFGFYQSCKAFSEMNARHSHMDVIIGIISVTPSTFMIFMTSDGIIEINRCDDILFHGNLSLIHKHFHPWNSSEHETGDFSGLAQFYFLLLIYQPNQLRTIHLSIIELEFKIVWLSKIFTVWNPLRKAPRRPFDAPVLILCPTDESRKWSESYSL